MAAITGGGIVRIRAIFKDHFHAEDLGEAHYRKLETLVPEAKTQTPRGPCLWIELFTQDPRYQQVRDILKDAGKIPKEVKFRAYENNEYWLALERVYEPTDLEAAEWFVIQAFEFFDAYGWDEQGRLRLHNKPWDLTKCDFLSEAGSTRMVVRRAIYDDLLKTPGMKYMTHRELATRTKTPSAAWQKRLDAYVEITSTLILPPLKRDNLFDKHGKPYEGRPEQQAMPVDGLYQPAELHYVRSAIKDVPPFGLALTREPITASLEPELIASKAFYHFCSERNIKLNWTPVRFDD